MYRPQLEPNFLNNNQQQQYGGGGMMAPQGPFGGMNAPNAMMLGGNTMGGGFNQQNPPPPMGGGGIDPFSQGSNGFKPQPQSYLGMNPPNNPMTGGTYNQPFSTGGFQNPTGSLGGQLPGMHHVNQLPNYQARLPDTITFEDLNAEQQKFFAQIQIFLTTHSLTLDAALTQPPLNYRPLSTHISKEDLNLLGRHFRVDMISQQSLDDLASKLTDRNSIQQDLLLLDVISRLLNSSASTVQSPSVDYKSNRIADNLQKLKDLMVSIKKDKVADLFAEGTVFYGDGDQLIDKDLFQSKLLTDVLLRPEEASEIVSVVLCHKDFTKVSLIRVEEQLAGLHSIGKPEKEAMSAAKADEIVNEVFDHLKRFLAMNEVNLVDIFNESEEGDSYFDRQELARAFQKCRFTNQGPQHEERMEAIFTKFDPMRTRKIDYILFLKTFYQKANSNRAPPPSTQGDKLLFVYENVRKYLEKKQLFSIAGIFLTEYLVPDKVKKTILLNEPIRIDSENFFYQLTNEVGIKDLKNERYRQMLFMTLVGAKLGSQEIDYQKFADLIGYDMPKGTDKETVRKSFYKTLLKDMGPNFGQLENIFTEEDTMLERRLHFTTFQNVLQSVSPSLVQLTDQIKIIADDFNSSKIEHQVDYPMFVLQVQREYQKQKTLHKVYLQFYQLLIFKESVDLYGVVCNKQDKSQDRKFSRDEFPSILQSALGCDEKTALHDTTEFFNEFEPKKHPGYILFFDIEADYKEYIEHLRKNSRLPTLTSLPDILKMLQRYEMDSKKTLRQIFGKNKAGVNDGMNQYEFQRIIEQIADSYRLNITKQSITLLSQLISSKQQQPLFGTKQNEMKQVSFIELLTLYNDQFQLQGEDNSYMLAEQLQGLITYVSKVTQENAKNKFNIRMHFILPESPFDRFVSDLKNQPFYADKEFPLQALQELGRNYGNRPEFSRVNTNQFCFDIESKALKMRDKDLVFGELRKAIVKKNTTIEVAFAQALPEIIKFQIDQISARDFFHVFMFLECKNITEESVTEMLKQCFSFDENWKFSIKEFVNEFQQFRNIDKTESRRGRRLYQNLGEILKRIAFVISGRGLKNFGTLLADQDHEGKFAVQRDAFYRTIECLQFGLGEGDILEIIKNYASSGNHVDILKFKDDINVYLKDTPEFQVELKTVMNSLVGSRVVDVIEEESQNKNLPKVDAKTQNMFKVIARDILCGLYLKDSDIMGWFPKFGTFKKGCLTKQEFFSGVDSLDATILFDKPEQLLQSYYELLVARQQNNIGYLEPLLLIDQLNLFLNKDTGSAQRGKLIEDLLLVVAVNLTDQRLPLGDILKQYDPQNTGQMYKSDFSSQFLDNYLHLQPKLMGNGGLHGLSMNMKALIATRYCPVAGQLSFRYDLFLDDMKRKEADGKGSIKIYLTKKEVDLDETVDVHEDRNFIQPQPKTTMIELPSLSKRNTHVTVATVTKQFIKGGMPIGSYMFDDIMLATYQRGQSVETFFCRYSRPTGSDYLLGLEDFSQAMSILSVDWNGNPAKVAEFFNSLDMVAHQGQQRFVSITDLGEAILLNSSRNVDEFISESIMIVHKALKEKNMLGRLRDLFNFMNSNRDETCEINEFKRILKELVESGLTRSLSLLNDHKYDQIAMRYKTSAQPHRLQFSMFIKDIEFCDQGIAPSQIWAIDLAANIMKATLVNGFESYEKLFQRYARMQDTLYHDDFKKIMEELKLKEYHSDQEIQEFFSFVSSGQSKISLTQLVNSLKRLAPKSVGLLIQTIFEGLWAETKKNNMSFLTVNTTFTEYDQMKTGYVSVEDFSNALQIRLQILTLSALDLQVLSNRYQARTPSGETMILYERFFVDYQRFEKLGLRAGYDPLKEQAQGSGQRQGPGSSFNAAPMQQSNDSRALYAKLSAYCQKSNIVDRLCETLYQKDVASGSRGCLSLQQIKEIFTIFQMTLNTKQINDLLQPVPTDPLDGAYYYLIVIELAFGKVKSQQVQAKSKLSIGQLPKQNMNQAVKAPAVMSQRFKEQIEVKLSYLQAIIHQLTKGSYLLNETEFTRVFRQAGISMSSQDHEVLQHCFSQLRSIQTNSIDFRGFLRHQGIKETTAQVITALQKVIQEHNIRLTDEDGTIIFPGQDSTVGLSEFNEFLALNKIEIPGFTPAEINETFQKIAERQERMPKSIFVKILKGERDVVANQEWLPYIVNEFVYHIINNQINIFKFVNPQAKVLSPAHFETLLEKIRYKPSNLKDFPTLIQFFSLKKEEAIQGANLSTSEANKYVSIDKILEQIRKLAPEYALSQAPAAPKKPGQQNSVNEPKAVLQASGQRQFAAFNQRVKDVLQKINEALKRDGLTKEELFSRIDASGDGVLSELEFIKFFSENLILKGISYPDDIVLLFQALDSNRDDKISVNEFCLCIDGIQKNLQERLRSFDPDLEKSLKEEISHLFDFFDSNKDGRISFTELQLAIKAQIPYASTAQINQIMKETDKNSNKEVDRDEFTAVMLPQMKLEIINNEKDFDDLRRLFKQFDSDQNNFLGKQEFREALSHLGISLSEVQLNDLIREIDLDNNGIIDIDEFIAFLSLAEQVKFKNPANKAILVKIRHARKLQPMDFFNCFKNLPQTFQPAMTQEFLERKDKHKLSWGLYPQFDTKTMTFRELAKLEEVQRVPTKTFIAKNPPGLAAEITLEETFQIPIPKKEDFQWDNITNREIRACLIDMKSKEILSNVWNVGVSWRQDQSTKWLFQSNNTEVLGASGRQIILKTQQWSSKDLVRDVHLMFEFVIYTSLLEKEQQICCAWGSLPISTLDKQAKQKLVLKGGSPLQEQKINKEELHQDVAGGGFGFIRMLTANTTEDPTLVISVKPFLKLTEQQQLHISMLPSTYIVNKKLLSFAAAFRLYCQQKLTKTQQQMLAPGGNFGIAQFCQVFDSPDLNLLLAETWDHHFPVDSVKPHSLPDLLSKLEDSLLRLYAIIHWQDFGYDKVYPTRSSNIDGKLWIKRQNLVIRELAPVRWSKMGASQKPTVEDKENIHAQLQPSYLIDYKPFNIAEMEVQIVGNSQVIASKTDELTQLYQQLGLIMN